MQYDTHFRHNDALQPDALASIRNALHALNTAVEDCGRAGRSIDRDAAVLLLAHHLGAVARAAAPDTEALRFRCRLDRREIIDHPALTAIAGNPIGDHPAAKRTFHAQARSGLRRLGEALGLEAGALRIGTSNLDGRDVGMSFLRHPDIEIDVVLRALQPGRELSYARVHPSGAVGATRWLPIADLLDPERLAGAIEAAIGPLSHPLARAA